MESQNASLQLEDGRSFSGTLHSKDDFPVFAELVFNTELAGYPESLTDPSYASQILVLTYPLIGNYGMPPRQFWESSEIQVAGLVIDQLCETPSHYQAEKTLRQCLEDENIPLMTGVDTRALAKHLRERGSALACLTPGQPKIEHFPNPNAEDLVATVSPSEAVVWKHPKAKKKIIAVDFGMKASIWKELQRFPWELHRVPYDYDYSQDDFDGLFLSNGPGDPERCLRSVEILRATLERKLPIFGICLGHQMLALASGARTYKLKYGHRGQNQPCQDLETGFCLVTSQNHGYAVLEESLPEEWRVSFRHLNDGTVAGIAHRELPFFSVQFHPEAAPGPQDSRGLFECFYEKVISEESTHFGFGRLADRASGRV